MAYKDDVPYDRILADLRALEDELRSWGLHQEPDRLSSAADNLQVIVDAVNANRAIELEKRPDFEDLVYSTMEGREFAEIQHGLEPMNKDELGSLFKDALAGQVNPETERAGKESKGRSTAFQLWVGASLRGAGQEVHFERDSDVFLQLPFGQVLIECKRPYRAQNIGTRLDEGRAQLRTNLPKYGGGTAGGRSISLRALIDTGRKIRE